jgi:hypothetical protein
VRPTSAWRLALSAATLVLAWRIIQVNAVLYEDDGSPRLGPAHSVDANTARSAIADALRQDPAWIAPLLDLARLEEKGSAPSRAASLYAAALRLAPLDRDVLQAKAGFELRSGSRDEGLVLLGKLVMHYGETWAWAFPILAASLASGRDSHAWQTMTAADPPWLGPFVLHACGRGTDPLALAPIVARRAMLGRPVTEEADCLVQRLSASDRWNEAYQVWLNSLPKERLADVGFVFNGGFEFLPTNGGFDWIVDRRGERESGYAVELAGGPGVSGRRALRVTYGGRRLTGVPIRQYLALVPGTYDLSGIGRADGLKLGRGVQWTVRCVNGGKTGGVIASSERFVGSSEWRPFSFQVAVAAGCRGQVLQLEPSGADEGTAFLSGVAWFDDLAARRSAH